MNPSVTIDLVTQAKDGTFGLVLVEEGPWPPDAIVPNLRALQARLHTCLNAVFGGQLLERYPDSRGRPISIRVDAYDTPRAETEAFLERYAEYIRTAPEVRQSVTESGHVPEVSFEYRWYSIAALEAARAAERPTLGARFKAWFRRT